MKVTFNSKKEFENFKIRKCPRDLNLKQNRCAAYACKKCWEEALEDLPEGIEIEVNERC